MSNSNAEQLQQRPASNSPVILNANLDLMNVCSFEDFSNITISTLRQINDIIIPLCGPKAIHDLVIYPQMSSQFISNVFSNDGIHILKSIEHMSPIQSYIVNYVRYIAERVDRSAGDGTSTAIFVATNLIIKLFEALVELHKNINVSTEPIMKKNRDIMQLTHALSDEVSMVLHDLRLRLDEIKIDLKELDVDVRSKLIYQLAYTTSKGNHELSQFALTMFLNLPEDLYEQRNYRRSSVETEIDFKIETPEHDAMISVMPSNNTVYNAELFTELFLTNCDLLIYPYFLYDVRILQDYIESRKETDRKDIPLVIVYNKINPETLSALERSIDSTLVTLCQYTIFHPVFNDNPIELLTVLAMASIDTTEWKTVSDFENSVIYNVECRLKDRVLFISNMFEAVEDDILHPNYISGSNANYNKLCKELESKIRAMKSAHTQNDNSRELSEFVRIYQNMICSKLPMLIIGGSSTNHLANINIVDDVLGAVSVVMRHGVVLDLIPKLIYLLENNANESLIRHDFTTKILVDILYEFASLTYGSDDTGFDLSDSDAELGLHQIFLLASESTWYTINEDYDSIQVVQSYKAIHETITRLIETVPKLISIDKVIVPNSVMNTKEK